MDLFLPPLDVVMVCIKIQRRSMTCLQERSLLYLQSTHFRWIDLNRVLTMNLLSITYRMSTRPIILIY